MLVRIDLTASSDLSSKVPPAASGRTEGPSPTLEGLHLLDFHEPSVVNIDLGVTRGDGIFKTLGVVDGAGQALHAHLSRLHRSARMLDLPVLDLSVIETGIRLAIQEHDPLKDLSVKVIVTRGAEGTGKPTAWANAFPGPDYSEQ